VLLLKLRPLILTAVLLFMLIPEAANANGGPLHYPAEGYGRLELDENSKVSLVHEKVTYTFREVEKYKSHAEVTVQYELHNTSDSSKDLEVLFVTPASEAFMVSEGDKEINVIMDPKVKTVNWQHAQVKNTVIDPVSGKELRLSNYSAEIPPAQGARFPLSFEPNETKNIVINYIENGGMYNKGVITTIFSHLYYLTPAAFWEEEPHVELEIRLSAPGAKLHSNLLMEQTDSKTFKANFNELPSEDWYFSYTYPKRLLYPTNIEKDHNLLVLGTVAALTVIAAALALLFRKSFLFTISAFGIFGFTVYYISKMGGYPFNDIFVAFIDLVVGVGLVICDILIRGAIRRRREMTKNV
jgi:hypothetical protein